MVDKLHEYEGWTGRAHVWRDRARSRISEWRIPAMVGNFKARISGRPRPTMDVERNEKKSDESYSHIYRYEFDSRTEFEGLYFEIF